MEIKKFSDSKTMNIVTCALFAALIAVSAQITFPLLSTGVPVTLQTFGVTLCAAVGGSFLGVISTSVYVLLGAVGVPVFAAMKGGIAVLFGVTGGFIYGFIPFAFLSGIGSKNIGVRIGFSLAGLAVCHLIGAVQFALLTQRNLWESLLLVSVPFLIKDVVSVVSAQLIAIPIRKAIANFVHN